MSTAAMQTGSQQPYTPVSDYAAQPASSRHYGQSQLSDDERYYLNSDVRSESSRASRDQRRYQSAQDASSSPRSAQALADNLSAARHITPSVPMHARAASSPVEQYDGGPIPPPRTSSQYTSPTLPTSSSRHTRRDLDQPSGLGTYIAGDDAETKDRTRDDAATTTIGASRSRRKGPPSPDMPHRAASTRERGEQPGLTSSSRSEATMLASGAPAPLLRENSEVINRVVVSDPRVDELRMQERIAEAQPAPISDFTTLPGIADDEPRQQRRQDYSKSSSSRRKEIQFGDYVLGQTLGEGEFGKVKLGWKKDGSTQVAIKLIRRESVANNATRLPKIRREINILSGLAHPNIVRLHEMVETERHIGIILEYASGGELFDYILNQRYLKDPQARRLFAQLVSGVGYLHKKGIVHRDLKLENLLLDQNRNIIITDFGFANTFNPAVELDPEIEYNLGNKDFVRKYKLDQVDANGMRKGDLMQTSCGSPCYAAPELVVSDSLYTGRKVDVWSCGVILYAMLAGYLPFDDDPANPEGDNINLLYKYITTTPLTFPEYVSPHARDLLRRILVPDPRKRADLFEVARHSWLNEYHHVVAHITSSTTNLADIANTTVSSEMPDERGTPGIPRSASVRQPKTASPRPTEHVATDASHFGTEDHVSTKRDRSTRHTLQPEYVAPRSETVRQQEIPTTRRQPPQAVSAIPSSYVQKQLPPDPPREEQDHTSQPTTVSPVRPARDVPRSVSDNSGGFVVPTTSSSDRAYYTTARPTTQGSLTAANGQPTTRPDLRLPSRGSYGQPVAPTVAATTVQGRVTQPAKGANGYNIPGPSSQSGTTNSMAQPGSQQMPPPSLSASSKPEQKGHHRRSSTLSGLGERLFGRSTSVHRKEKQEARQRNAGRKYPPTAMKDPYPFELAQPRMSTDSKRSFSFGLKKKESSEMSDAQEKPHRFSLLGGSLSLKGILGGSRDQLRDKQAASLNSSQQSDRPPTGGPTYATAADGMQDRRFNNFSRPPQAQHRYGASVGGDVYGSTAVYKPDMQQPGGGHQSSGSRSQLPQYPEDGYDGRPSMSENRPERAVLTKPNRRFPDDHDNLLHGGGSTGAVRKVQDFFRRRGRARADGEYR